MIRATIEHEPQLVIEIHPAPTDPNELNQAQARQERARRNEACWQQIGKQLYAQHRGKYICFAGGEPFVADSPQEAKSKGTAAHPEDDSSFVIHVPKERILRIYAYQRTVGHLQ
jgi:hypothetical protein